MWRILEARIYDKGIKEVIEKLTKNKANMLYQTEDIFANAQYLYSTPDYENNPTVYRWDYFYTPVEIGGETVGVRIAIRDMTKSGTSQIYHWGIKKAPSLDGGVGQQAVSQTDVSSDGDINILPQDGPTVNSNLSLEEASKKYGRQAKAMVATYNQEQDVAKFDRAYGIAYAMGMTSRHTRYRGANWPAHRRCRAPY